MKSVDYLYRGKKKKTTLRLGDRNMGDYKIQIISICREKHLRFYHAIFQQGHVPCVLRKAGANASSRNNVWLALKFIMAILQPSVAQGHLQFNIALLFQRHGCCNPELK